MYIIMKFKTEKLFLVLLVAVSFLVTKSQDSENAVLPHESTIKSSTNKRVVLKCVIRNASTVVWSADNAPVQNDSNYIITSNVEGNGTVSSQLIIVNATVANTGKYSCSAGNENSNVSNIFNVFFYKLPSTIIFSVHDITSKSAQVSWWYPESEVGNATYTKITYESDSTRKVAAIVSGKMMTWKLNELLAFTRYSVSLVQYFNFNETLSASSQNFTTLQAAPSPPAQVWFQEKSENSIVVAWERPQFPNGILTFVSITYKFNVSLKTIQKIVQLNYSDVDRKHKLDGLLPNVKYRIEVRFKTEIFGQPSIIFVRTEMGDPQVAPEDFRQVSLNSTSIKLLWRKIPAHLQGGNLSGYTITFQSNHDNVYVDKSATQHTIYGLTPYTTYNIAIAAMTIKGGVSPKATLVVTTEQGVPTVPRNINAKAHTVHQQNEILPVIGIKWEPPAQINGRLVGAQISYRKLHWCIAQKCKRDLPLYKPFTINYTLTDLSLRVFKIYRLDPFSLFAIKVRERTEAGWGEFSHEIEITTKPGKASAPKNVALVKSTHDSVLIGWDPPQFANGIISLYRVFVYLNGENTRQDRLIISNRTKELLLELKELKSETTYKIEIMAYNNFTGFPSDIISVTTLKPPSITEFPWLIVVLGCVAFVMLIGLVFAIVLILTRRSRNYKNVQTDDAELETFTRSKPVIVSQLKQYCKQQHANGGHGFQQEFEAVVMQPHHFTYEHSKKPFNESKNRYSNVLPYDHTRVVLNTLNNDPTTTYINASYIDGFKKQKQFIATQGPLPETVIDFWRMIWETNCPIIVMLTNLVENTVQVKCEQYWPQGKGLQYKDIVVTVKSVREMTDYTVRVFALHKFKNPEAGCRHVRQYHFTTWPDHDVPAHPTSMLSFARHVMSYMDTLQDARNIVVHCSAGVGRTGTFIAIESCLRQIVDESRVDVFGTVFSMRMQRNYMVQTEPQYTFIYDALLDSVVCGNTEIAPADLPAKIRYLHEQDPTTCSSNFASEFKRLESGISPTKSNQYTEASHQENKQKNRFLNILPYDKNRVRLVPIAGCRKSDYVNASIIDGFQQRNAFIATQGPLENTVNDFWRMMLEKKVHIIVMLTKLEEKGKEKCYLYWPQADAVSYGSIHVEVLNSRKDDENLITHEFRLTNRETGRSWVIMHFWYLGWPENGCPESGSDLIQLIGTVQKAKKVNADSGPILVHCSGGVGRTGVFTAVLNSIERLKAKGVVDIFQTTRALRLQRTAMVQTVDQYMFCYQALKDYLDSFDLTADAKC